MSEIKDGGPAFPQQCDHTMRFNGLSLRDYFAAKAMQAALASVVPGPTTTHAQIAEAVAPIAYMMADAMLRARETS